MSPARTVTTTGPTAKACDLSDGGTQGDQDQWTVAAATVTTDADSAIVVSHDANRPAVDSVNNRVYVCVRPKLDNSRVGPWTLSSGRRSGRRRHSCWPTLGGGGFGRPRFFCTRPASPVVTV